MIKVIKSGDRYHADRGWLDTRWHFSFDEYYDPKNTNWGPLRVFNDDIVRPGQGFGSHGHRDMEIVTYGIEGELEHKDNTGNTGVIQPGDVQVMSAGTGIIHSEYNHSAEKPVHFLQLWIMPRTKGLKPRYEQRHFDASGRRGRLLPVVSSGNIPETLAIDQGATVYISSLLLGEQVEHESAEGRKGYAFIISGSASLNSNALMTGDQARVSGERNLVFRAASNLELIFLDLPA